MKLVIPYYRVSTERQGESGLGLEAQQKAVTDYMKRHNLKMVQEYVELESGRNKKRPILQEALAQCKRDNAILLIAKLDRLARNVAFISALMEAKVDFTAVDMPEANKLVIHIMAAFAEHEADEIRTRTKAALQAAKRKGVILGKNGREVLSKKNKYASYRFAYSMIPIIKILKEEGRTTIREIMNSLNIRGIAPYTGLKARWHINSVANLLKKIKQINQYINHTK